MGVKTQNPVGKGVMDAWGVWMPVVAVSQGSLHSARAFPLHHWQWLNGEVPEWRLHCEF